MLQGKTVHLPKGGQRIPPAPISGCELPSGFGLPIGGCIFDDLCELRSFRGCIEQQATSTGSNETTAMNYRKVSKSRY